MGGLLLQASQAPGHDLGWLLVATRRWLEGAEVYGRDVFEWNPPANLQLLMPPVAASLVLPITAIGAVRVYLALLAGSSLLLSDAALAELFGRERVTLRRQLLAVASFALFVFVAESFGQREHLIAILLLPELVVVAARVAGRELPRGLAIAAGIAAAVAIMLKPHYVALLLCLELYVALRRRSLLAWWRPDFIALACAGLVQLAALFWLTPGYLDTVVPIALDTYWVYQSQLGQVVKPQDVMLLPLGLAVLPLLRGRRELLELGSVLLLAAVVFYLVAALQRTGWRYHLLPFQLAMILLLSLPLLRVGAEAAAAVASEWRLPWLRGAAAGGIALLVLLGAPTRYGDTFREGAVWRAGGSTGGIARLEQLFRERAAGGWVYVISPSLVSVFPAVNRAQVGWTSRFSAFYLPAAIARQRGGDSEAPARLDALRADWIERFLRDAVIEDLRRHPPALILIDRVKRRKVFEGVPFDLLAYFLEDPRFGEIWQGYQPLGRVGRFEVATRR